MNILCIGFCGIEDLGGGLKVIFQLENGFKLDNGVFDGDFNQLFNCQFNVGLEGGFGCVVVGCFFFIIYDFILLFDLMGYLVNYFWVILVGVIGGCKDGMLIGVFNLVKYQGEFVGVKVGVMYGFGEVVGEISNGVKYGVGLGWGLGLFSVVVIYDCNNSVSIVNVLYDCVISVYLVVGYQLLDVWKFNFGYCYYKKILVSGVVDLCSDFIWGGVMYKFMLVMSVIGVIYYQNIKNVVNDVDFIMYLLCLKYVMFKCIDLYLSMVYVKVKNNQLVGLLWDDVGFFNSQFGMILGMQYCF